MQSLFTPLSSSPMGAVQSGTDKPYRKVIYDVTVDPWTDQVNVSLAIGCEEDEDWTDDETYILSNEDLEQWLEDNDKLDGDDTGYVAAYNGDPLEVGGPYKLAYVDHIRSLESIPDVIEYLKAKKIIPDYIVDQSLITINSL